MDRLLPASSHWLQGGPHPAGADPGRMVAAGFNLLLVSRSPDWRKAVTDASEVLGHVNVLTCGARDALARLAGTASHYSHLLIDRDDADGLLNELADLA